MKKASLSVFFSMILVVTMTLVFTLNECVRAYELAYFAKLATTSAAESTFAEYNAYLWEKYKILALDMGYGKAEGGISSVERRMASYAEANVNPAEGMTYARMYTDKATAKEYSILTDDDGAGVVYQGVRATKEGLLIDVLENVSSNIKDIENIEESDVDSKVNEGERQLSQAKEELRRKREEAENDDDPNTNPEDYPEPEEVEDNPLDAFNRMKQSAAKGMLATVISDPGIISEEKMDKSLSPSGRALAEGNYTTSVDNNLIDKALFAEYLVQTYGFYTDLKGHDGVKYELEYLVSGNEIDSENLESVVMKLMAVREGANFATIMKNESLKAQAGVLAATLTSFQPELYEVVKVAIIAAWAYVESTLDVRLLLKGGKVPIMKDVSQWTSDVAHLSSFLNVNKTAKETQKGISYKEYLLGLIALTPQSELGIRCCDVMENALHTQEDYVNVKMDNMIYRGVFELEYSANELFLSLFDNSSTDNSQYSFVRKKEISY